MRSKRWHTGPNVCHFGRQTNSAVAPSAGPTRPCLDRIKRLHFLTCCQYGVYGQACRLSRCVNSFALMTNTSCHNFSVQPPINWMGRQLGYSDKGITSANSRKKAWQRTCQHPVSCNNKIDTYKYNWEGKRKKIDCLFYNWFVRKYYTQTTCVDQ